MSAPSKLKDAPPGSREAKLAELVEAASPRVRLDTGQYTRIAARLEERRWPSVLWAIPVAAIASVMLYVERPQPAIQPSSFATTLGDITPTIARLPSFAQMIELVDRAVKIASQSQIVEPHASTSESRHELPRVRRASPIIATPTPTEARAFSSAIDKMHDDPKGALTALDRLGSDGALGPESDRVRVAILIDLGRRREALAVLDGIGVPSTELRVLRGELRAEFDRDTDAIADFSTVLVADDARFEERALYGSAVAHRRLHDDRSARQELERYLTQHPHGQFSVAARDALKFIR